MVAIKEDLFSIFKTEFNCSGKTKKKKKRKIFSRFPRPRSDHPLNF